MPAIRAFAAADIPQVALLHRRVWGGRVERFDWYRRYFTQVFLDSAGADSRLRSLVCQDRDQRILGFVGIVPRRVTVDGRSFQAAVSSQFIVAPSRHAAVVALQLAKAFVEGPQDLSIADEATDVSRRIWERLGGSTALLHSIYWTRPLRPAGLVLSYLARRRGFGLLAAAGQSLAAVADAVVTHLPGSHLRQRQPSASAAELSGETAVASAAAFCDRTSLRVTYDSRGFQQLLDRAGQRNADGCLMKVTLRNGSTDLGWYVCNLHGDHTAEVVQLAATPATVHDVLDHLFYHMWRHGAVSVTGRLDPRFMQALSDKYCLFHRRGPWVLINARRPELLRAFESGQAWFSPLDGEWSLRFGPEHATSC